MKTVNYFYRFFLSVIVCGFLMATVSASTDEQPELVIEQTVQTVLDEFISQRESLEQDKRKLYELVDRLASPLFDFSYISKLVLAKSWKTANDQQKAEFAKEFKKLLIITYATALFQYTGEERMTFHGSDLKERKGVMFAKVQSEVALSQGSPIPVEYALIRNKQGEWKIYNLTVGSLNMVLNYRDVIQSSIRSEGLDGTIATMKTNNDKNY